MNELSIINWSEDDQTTIDNMSLDTLILLMDREDQANKGHLEHSYDLEGELWNTQLKNY